MLTTAYAEPMQTCPQVGAPVRTDQSEGDCRTAHGCTQRICPLNGSFIAANAEFLFGAVGALDS